MSKDWKLAMTLSVVFLLFACTQTSETIQHTPTNQPQDTTTPPDSVTTELAIPTKPSQDTDTMSTSEATARSDPYPLSNPGPYHVGRRQYSFTDASRDNHEVGVTVWYPAIRPENYTGKLPSRDAAPDLSGAPYPLILSSTKMATILAPYLVTHGFTWASVDRIDTYHRMIEQMYSQPLDILFALHQVTTYPPAGLEGLIDGERAGTIGYSFDGYNSLAMSGARIDPEFYLAQCADPENSPGLFQGHLSSFSCAPAEDWEAFTAQAPEAYTVSEDGLWQAMTDDRIKAVIPMACEGWWLFGERGLAANDRPVMFIVGTQDGLYSENSLIFEKLGTRDKTLISFIGQDHMMVYQSEQVARTAHFVAAFFGYHLQGRDDVAWYFSEEFVNQHDDLAWGTYEK